MATHTLQRPAPQASRVHDYLYDPHFITSSDRDHARATFQAHTANTRVLKVPNYKTMFSDLRHHPRYAVKLDATDPVPRFVSRQWRGYADQQREALTRYKTFNYDPSVKVPTQTFEDPKIGGQMRFKYFRRPIIPFMQQVPPDVLLATTRQDTMGLYGGQEQAPRPVTPPYRTRHTQTDYRDSEAQTDPYTPEYVVRPGSAPELLTLASLSYGKGLPAGLAEIDMIERARAKRAWEATLPPLNDSTQLEKRRKMMDEMETNEWALREHEIEKLQEARLEVLQKLLVQREEHHQNLNSKRLDRLWARKQEEKEAKVKKIRAEHIKTIRKLSRKRLQVEGRQEGRDVVKDYSDFGSQTYAPLTRIGVFLDRASEQYVVKSRYLNSYQGLLELEAFLPDFVTQPRVKAPKPKSVTKAGFVKRKYRQEQQLAEVYRRIKDEQNKKDEAEKPLRFLQKIEKPVPRPPTPRVEVPSEDEERRELAVIYLQQLIRGRAVQNMMFEGKEKRIELIRELRTTHALQEAEQHVKKQERQATLALQRQRRLHEHKESFVEEALGQVEGSSLGDCLDFLSKELIRLQEERRIHAFAMLAERQRRIREAEESGMRQVEERRRREQDEIFKQVVKVHQSTVETYLEDVIMSSVEYTAHCQARDEVQNLASTINDVAYEIEDSRTGLESEEIVADLVHNFLLPEAQKQNVREKVQRHQRQYLHAAHSEIYKSGEEAIALNPRPQTAPQQSTPQPYQQVFGRITDSADISEREVEKFVKESVQDAKISLGGSPPRSRPGSKAGSEKGSKDGSVKGSKDGSDKGSRKGSREELKDFSVEGRKPGSEKGSRPGSAAVSQQESPGSEKGSRPGSEKGSRPGSAVVSRQHSPKGSEKGSRPGSGKGSDKGSHHGSDKGSDKGSRPGSAKGSDKGSRPGSAKGSDKGSRPGSAKGSGHGSDQGSRRGSAHGSDK